MDCIVVCEKSLIWFEEMPVVVGDEPMATGLFCLSIHYIKVTFCYMLFIITFKRPIIEMNDYVFGDDDMIVGICDDEKNVRELIAAYIGKVDDSAEILFFMNGSEVLQYTGQRKKIDILYLDIDLKDSPDGMGVATKLKEKQIKEGNAASALPLIIFITGLPDRMPEAFGVRAFQFLVKPIDEKQFRVVFEQAKKAVFYATKGRKTKSISVSLGGIKRTVLTSDIRFIESNGRKLIIHMKDEVVETYGTTADIMKELDKSFCQVHRSFIVNMNHISDYTRSGIQTTDGESVPMSKYKYKDFVSEYATFLESELC